MPHHHFESVLFGEIVVVHYVVKEDLFGAAFLVFRLERPFGGGVEYFIVSDMQIGGIKYVDNLFQHAVHQGINVRMIGIVGEEMVGIFRKFNILSVGEEPFAVSQSLEQRSELHKVVFGDFAQFGHLFFVHGPLLVEWFGCVPFHILALYHQVVDLQRGEKVFDHRAGDLHGILVQQQVDTAVFVVGIVYYFNRFNYAVIRHHAQGMQSVECAAGGMGFYGDFRIIYGDGVCVLRFREIVVFADFNIDYRVASGGSGGGYIDLFELSAQNPFRRT